ncbi:unnamed protein product [Adineta steineri]|uniref:Uncharacterized protein n=1 Tax=Adineta steineri TaxID=433720 RepID=A0A815PJC7_9BILA|nr:unnamed protein product [Adineta steineri]CAF1630157.1 unnamed protein product [Adineta steineri]
MNRIHTCRRAFECCRKVKHFCQNLNLFPSVPLSTDEHELKNQKISTRLYIFLFTLSLTILLLYTSLADITKTINVPTPTLTKYEQLYSKYSQTLTCPCKHISINYERFLSIEYTLHQACSSIFIKNEWISHNDVILHYLYTNNDPRIVVSYALQALGAFCELIKSTINNSLIQFNSQQYITASVAPSELFQSQAQSFIDQFKLSTTNNFLLSLNMIRKTTQGNAFLSGQLTNYYLTLINGSVSSTSISYSNCNCHLSNTCVNQLSFYKNNSGNVTLFDVPGFYIGCYVIEALLQSTLQCFYDKTCIDHLQVYLTTASPMNVTALDSSLPSQYSEDSTIKNLLNSLMIEEWNSTQLYDRYYDECQPIECTYTVKTRNNVIYIVTTVFGIIGGLITVLKLVVPRVVKFIRKKRSQLSLANVVPTVPPSADEHKLKNQKISTRLNVLLLILSTTILLLYTFLTNVTMTINVPTPTLTKYERLYSKYSQTLTCPCKHISINYEKFLHIEYSLHQVCTSIFITDEWISYLVISNKTTSANINFRRTGSNAFQALRAFCELVENTIDNSLIQFNSSQYITASVASPELFQSQAQSFINQFISSTTNTFVLSLNTIRNSTHGDSLVSGLLTNYLITIGTSVSNEAIVLSSPVGYSTCSCVLSSRCIAQSSILSSLVNMGYFYIPGFYTGCYVIEALLQSTLECFYDQNCIDQLQFYLSSVSPMNVTALNLSLPSQYSEDSTIENLLNNLMVEEWYSTQLYDRYYDECQPIECTYTIKTRNNVIYITTTMFGIIGGLITILSCIVPQVVKFVRKKKELTQPLIDQLQVYLTPPVLKNVTALDSSLPSQYFEDSTIEYLLNNLMIEEWNSTQMYDRYYDECQPIECTYTIRTRNSILYVITILIGLIGGLTTVSKIFVPILVKIIVYCFRKWRNKVVPQISIIET